MQIAPALCFNCSPTVCKFGSAAQCDEVGELKLNLQGSALQLLRGKLEGVSLTARKVSFQKLPLLRAELKTGALASTHQSLPSWPADSALPSLQH